MLCVLFLNLEMRNLNGLPFKRGCPNGSPHEFPGLEKIRIHKFCIVVHMMKHSISLSIVHTLKNHRRNNWIVPLRKGGGLRKYIKFQGGANPCSVRRGRWPTTESPWLPKLEKQEKNEIAKQAGRKRPRRVILKRFLIYLSWRLCLGNHFDDRGCSRFEVNNFGTSKYTFLWTKYSILPFSALPRFLVLVIEFCRVRGRNLLW